MNIDQLKQQIFDSIFSDQKLSQDLQKQLEADPKLNDYYEEIKFLYQETFSEPSERPGEAYWQQLDEQIFKETINKTSNVIHLFKHPLAIAAAVVLVFMSGFYASSILQTQSEPTQVVADSNKELKNFIHRSKVMLLTFVNIENDESDLLPLNLFYSKQLLSAIAEFETKYADDDELMELLSEMERVLLMIQSLQDDAGTSFKTVQYGVERLNMIEKLKQIDI